MDGDEMLNRAAQHGHGRSSNDQRQSNGGGSRNGTTSPSQTSSLDNQNGAGSNTIESVWGNLGFDNRFDNPTQNQRQNVNG